MPIQIDSIEERVKGVIVQTLRLEIEPGEIGDEDLLFGGDLGLDSMATMEIIVGLEEEFGIEVADEDLRVELFDSVRTLAGYIKTVLSAFPCGPERND